MTERIYKCIAEIKMEGVPQGWKGKCMNLRNWLMITGYYDYECEETSDLYLIYYMRKFRGKVLEEV